MTPQEAIRLVYCCMHVDDNDILTARDMAISALEKQIPKSVVFEGDGYDDKGELIYDIAYCPNCNSRFDLGYDEETNCCADCGQALDWSNEV